MAITAKNLVLQYLTGTYPADRDQLVERARVEGADETAMALFRALDARTYASPVDVRVALEQPSV